VRLVPYRLAYDGEWHVDLDSLRRAQTARTRAILVVSPNNPTGSYLKDSELAAMAETGLPVVCDEVFASYPLRRADARRIESVLTPAAAAIAPRSLRFALGGLSKLAALPQMKLGWIAVDGPAAHVDGALARLELVCDSFLSVGTPVQHALPALLASGKLAAVAIAARTAENLAVLRELVHGDSALSLLDVEGGWYATLRLPRTRSEEAWALELLAKARVHVHPGHFFDFPDEAYVVLSLLTPERAFAAGVHALAACVDASLLGESLA